MPLKTSTFKSLKAKLSTKSGDMEPQLCWTDSLPVAPSSSVRLSDFVPDLNGAIGSGQKSKKSGNRNGNGSSPPSTPTQLDTAPTFFDPYHVAFEKLGRLFPTVPKIELADIFNNHEGALDSCVSELLEKDVPMSADILDEATMVPFGSSTDNSSSEDKFEEWNSDVDSDIVGSSSSSVNNYAMELLPQPNCSLTNGGREKDENKFDGQGDAETSEDDTFEMTLPMEFARDLLHSFAHPEDKARSINPSELTVRIGADTAFNIYQSLNKNMLKTEAGLGNGISHSEGSTRSTSPTPTSTGGSMEEKFNTVAIALAQMELETTSGDPQLASIMDIESRIHQNQQDSRREYSAPYRNMAQNVQFCMLKKEYPGSDPAIVDEVFTQCKLDLDKTKAALTEMYPEWAYVPEADKPSSSTTDTGALKKYNPIAAQSYSQQDVQSMQETINDLETELTSKMAKTNGYIAEYNSMSGSHIKAHYCRQTQKMFGEMKGLDNELQYMRGIISNIKINDDNTLDLHGLKLDAAMRILKEFLEYKEHELLTAGTSKMTLIIITGQGLHSKNGCPILQPAVRNFLSQSDKYSYHSAKRGSYTVVLSRGSINRAGVK